MADTDDGNVELTDIKTLDQENNAADEEKEKFIKPAEPQMQVTTSQMSAVPEVTVKKVNESRFNKRTLQIVLAMLAVLLCLLGLAALAIAVKLTARNEHFKVYCSTNSTTNATTCVNYPNSN